MGFKHECMVTAASEPYDASEQRKPHFSLI